MGLFRTFSAFSAAAAGITLAALAGCSSYTMSSASGGSGASSSLTVPVMITDAPNDQLVSFSLTLNSIVLTDSSGATTNLLSSPATIEITHLNGIQAPLVTAKIPAGTYVSATFSYSNPQVTFIDSTGATIVANTVLANTSTTYTPPTAVTLNSSNVSLLVDLLAEKSIAISGTTVTVTPAFVLKPIPAAGFMPHQGDNETGLEARGTVVSASGSTLVIQPPSGANVTFTTDSSTRFQDVSGLSGLAAGSLVEVDFTVQSGNVLLANRVELKGSSSGQNGAQIASLLIGPVTSTGTGTFNMTLIDAEGPGVPGNKVGSTFTVTTNSSTVFAVSPQFPSLGGLPFTPTFTAATLTRGQTVAVAASAVSSTAGTATAAKVFLVPQTLRGTISAISTGSGFTAYTLTLPSGSAFSTLTGAGTVTVYSTSATIGMSSNAIAVGSAVRFNGLVFKTATGFAMIAGCSPDGAPAH
jgi:hypothetical protein